MLSDLRLEHERLESDASPVIAENYPHIDNRTDSERRGRKGHVCACCLRPLDLDDPFQRRFLVSTTQKTKPQVGESTTSYFGIFSFQYLTLLANSSLATKTRFSDSPGNCGELSM